MKQSARSGLRWALLVLAFLCVATMLLPTRRIASKIRRALQPAPLFANRTGGYQCYRIPAIVQTPNGTLLAFAEARKNDCSDFGDIRIVMRSSHDDGESWSDLQTVGSNGNLQAGNPVPVVDTLDPQFPQGRVFLFYTTSDTSEDELVNGHGSVHVRYRASTDDGATWTAPVEITSSVKLPSWGNYGTGPGHGLQLTNGPHKGRILTPAFHSEGHLQGGREVRAHSFFSDDHGQTWTLGPTVAWSGTSESTAAETSGGNVLVNSRDETGASKARILSISSDDGERWDKTFSARDLPDPACEGSMVSYTEPGQKPVLLFSNLLNTDASYRHGLTVSESTDGGRTWRRHAAIDRGASAYSDLVVMRGAKLGILWERSDDGIVFATRPIDHLF